MGSVSGLVGRLVASDTRRPRFEFSLWQLLLNQYFLLTVCRKVERKGKEAIRIAILFDHFNPCF